MGVARETALSSVRLSLGRFNTGEEIEEAAERLIRAARSYATA
jgi:cysteine sulfinate desulfinase/cysteine desulfurase-like protein